ncbi:MAG TPA: phosphatidate cytidylyltransferase [Alicyclobacillus sp.]|nr:phosphatidate cytidylyltransferase [Alicyclobacillus sp.]
MLRQRVITAVIGGGGFFAILYLGGPWIVVFIGIVAALAFGEWIHLKGVPLWSLPAVLGFAALEGIFFLTGSEGGLLQWVWPGSVGFDLDEAVWVVVVLFVLIPVLIRNEQTVLDTAFTLLGVLYLGILFRDFTWLRLSWEHGLAVCTLVLLSVWATDSAAYFVGRRVRGPKLAPVLSPNKTLSGSAAGILISPVPALVFFAVDIRPYSLPGMVILGMVASFAGQVGDLAESAVKRAFGAKDSGNLLPGHGGVLDRFDSLLLAGSVAYHLLGYLR